MSFAEFQIRLFAWKRTEERAWEKVRRLAWHIESASFHRQKKMPSLEQFMPLDIDKKASKGLSEEHKQMYLDAVTEYQKQIS